MENKTKYFCI